ncbi:hypothetical protein NDU88_003440 [Pleurodeles waltl]|uniref:Uncharacterized protein n=1 Tax=Pleurodeles waltl TaxID=8319 RepID=A0AAV7SDM3_PLEWA|nr:hypothetical protein NDU88_003440 [Pleurodeles waltl]
MELGSERGPDMPSGEEQDLRQILVAMQHSLAQNDGKIDSLSYRRDRMTERLIKHAERLDQSERVTPDHEALLDYLTLINMPRLTDEDRDILMSPLTLEEMDGALRGMAEAGQTINIPRQYQQGLGQVPAEAEHCIP